jgi:hypothetical protein
MIASSFFLDSDWITHEGKLRIALSKDNPAYSDGIHRHIGYSQSSVIFVALTSAD